MPALTLTYHRVYSLECFRLSYLVLLVKLIFNNKVNSPQA